MADNSYVVTAHKTTTVSHTVKCRFLSSEETDLIICKHTRLEVHRLSNEGLVPMMEVPIYGRVLALRALRPKNEKKDLLFVLLEYNEFCVLYYDETKKEILTKASGDLSDKMGRCVDNPIAIVDPQLRMIACHLYEGMVKIIPIKDNGTLEDAFNARLDELTVIDLAFVDRAVNETSPAVGGGGGATAASPAKGGRNTMTSHLAGHNASLLGAVYQDRQKNRHFKTYEVNLAEKELNETNWKQPSLDEAARMLIPIPKPLGGCVIIGENSVVYHHGAGFFTITKPPKAMICWDHVEETGARQLLGDDNGGLYTLFLKNNGVKVFDIHLETLGFISIPSCISYLDNGFVFIGSKLCDSQLCKLNTVKNASDSFVDVVDSYINLGPIVDFTLVDNERQGQGRMVICSGGGKSGSLRIIRNGIGINEIAQLELVGIKSFFALSASKTEKLHTYLVLSFVGSSRVLCVSDEEAQEVDINGFDSDAQTLYAGNVAGTTVVQVTDRSVRLIDLQSGLCDEMTFPSAAAPSTASSITLCASYNSQIVLSTGGGRLFLVTIAKNNKLAITGRATMKHEISCVNIEPVPVSQDSATINATSTLCAVGLWNDMSVHILALPSLQTLSTQVLGGDFIPRSILMATFENETKLLCALGDGLLNYFTLNPVTGELRDRNKVTLGTQPISLFPFYPTNGNGTHVFAASDRPTVIHSKNKKLVYANVNLTEVKYALQFNSQAFPDCLAVASETNLTIGVIDDIQKLHVKTVVLDEVPRRIAHQNSSRSFLLLTQKLKSDGGLRSYAKVLDDATFNMLDSFTFPDDEEVLSVLSCDLNRPTVTAAATTAAAGDAAAKSGGDDAMDIDDGAPGASSSNANQMNVDNNNNNNNDNNNNNAAASGSNEEFFIVGTGFESAQAQVEAPQKGRLLAFKIHDRRMILVAEYTGKGAFYCSSYLSAGRIATTCNGAIDVFNFGKSEGSRDEYEFTLLATHQQHIFGTYLATRGNYILHADLMKSVNVLVFRGEEAKAAATGSNSGKSATGGTVPALPPAAAAAAAALGTGGIIEDLAKDTQCVWSTSCEFVDDDTYVLADDSYNLLTLKRNTDPSDGHHLSTAGCYHLGEHVNRLKLGSLHMRHSDRANNNNNKESKSSIIFVTASGMIGYVISLTDEHFRFFLDLQKQINNVVQGVGGFKHPHWRAFRALKNADATKHIQPSKGYIDGDLIATFVDLDKTHQEVIAKNVNKEVEYIVKLIADMNN